MITLKCTGDRYLEDIAYRLRYDQYLKEGYIDYRNDAKFTDCHDTMDYTLTYLTIEDDKVCGSIRCCLGADNLPANEIFRDEIENDIRSLSNGKVLELNRLVTCLPDSRKSVRFVRDMLVNMKSKANLKDYRRVYIAVRPSHSKFYEKMFGYKKISGPKPYPGLKFNTVLMTVDWD